MTKSWAFPQKLLNYSYGTELGGVMFLAICRMPYFLRHLTESIFAITRFCKYYLLFYNLSYVFRFIFDHHIISKFLFPSQQIVLWKYSSLVLVRNEYFYTYHEDELGYLAKNKCRVLKMQQLLTIGFKMFYVLHWSWLAVLLLQW